MRKLVAILALLLTCAATPALANPFGYAVDTVSNLYQVDLGTGARTLIGATGVQFLEGIAISPGGRLFATSINSSLYELNQSTGASTLIGNMGIGNIEGLDFSGDTLLGISHGETPIVFSINTTNASATEIRRSLVATGPTRALAALGGNDVLIRTDWPVPEALRRMDLTTGASTVLGSIGGGSQVTGLDFASDGNLYGVNANGQVLRINPNNASTVVVGGNPGVFWLDLTTFVPEPTTALLAICPLLVMMRRHSLKM